LTEKQTGPRREHEEVAAPESRALVLTSDILQKKWLVIGVPVIAILAAIVIIWVFSSRNSLRQKAAVEYESATGAQEFMNVYKEYSNVPYGAYALARAAKDAIDSGHYDKGREVSEKFLKEYPNNNYAVFVKRYIAVSIEAEGKYEEAIARYKDILESDPRMQPVADSLNIDIGRCYEQIGEYETAKSYYEKVARKSGPEAPSGQPGFGVLSPEAFSRIERVERKDKIAEAAEKQPAEAIQ